MNILLVTQLFETLEDNGSDRLLFFAQELIQRGNKVKIITANFDYKAGKKRFDNKSKIYKQVSGIDVVYLPVYSNFRGSYFRRFLFFISFMLSCFHEVMVSARTSDVIWAISTPLTVPFLCALVSRAKKVPLVSEITDVWPDAAVHSGIVKSKLLIFIARKIELFCYKNSSRIICLTEGILNNIINKGVEGSKTCLVTNGVDLNLFNEANSVGDGTSTQLSSFSDKFIAMYLGAHGHYNALDTILDAAIELRYDENVLFVLVGDGERKKHLMARVISEKLTNVLFFDPITRRDCPEILSKADCFLLPNLAGEFFDCNLPNKLFDYLASSRPIIVAGFVESARLVNKINAGFVIGAEEPEQLAEAVKKVSMLSQKERIEIGERGSLHVKKYYNRQKHADTILSILKDVIR